MGEERFARHDVFQGRGREKVERERERERERVGSGSDRGSDRQHREVHREGGGGAIHRQEPHIPTVHGPANPRTLAAPAPAPAKPSFEPQATQMTMSERIAAMSK